MNLKPLALAVAVLPLTLAANTQLGVHEHGFGQLNLAQDGNHLVLELFAPAADIVGFEHNPTTSEDKAAFDHAINKARDGAALFSLTPTAGCTLTDVAHANGDEHHHDDHADHDGEHKHHHDDEHDGEHGHKDISLSYHYQCSQPDALSGIEVSLFEQFPSFTRIELQGILPTGQVAATLTPDQAQASW
ncbi:DUF2796 domain-containing protein [Oceanimonas sp. MB9]|uniref:DUF2796 domain-containing protein n=1 Tax=Oceanimonas sp. MB9 TaxID=2588453 RepID=UPI0013F5F236|nr:DUF2796 domain-containing protein [Oceanimonas sp. MB9]NHI01972.1 hypothetical protein [Oceanimonas sp. MB9]